MNNLIITLVFVATHIGSVEGQTSATPVKSASVSRMEIFQPWQGHWKGEGTMNRHGQPQKFQIEEHIAMKLEGTILTVEGIGTDTQAGEEKIVHHAFGVLNFDEAENHYTFKTYLADGKTTTAWFNVTDASTYQWGFDVPTGKVRYNININHHAGTWDEKGEFSNDGNTWYPFLQMQLKKME